MVQRTIWRAARVALGLAFLGLGVAGLFLPFLQGILFMVIGLTLLGRESPRARRILERLRGHLPQGRRPAAEPMRHQGASDAG